MAKLLNEESTAARLDTGEIVREIKPVFFKTEYNHDRDLESTRTALLCLDPTKCQQHLAEETEVKNILAKFMETGELPATGQPIFQDIPDNGDFQDQIVTTWEMNAAWEKLSPEIRNTLKDPKTYLEYVNHCLETGDLEPLEKLGMVPKPPTPAPTPAPVPPSPPGGSPAPTVANGPPSGPTT